MVGWQFVIVVSVVSDGKGKAVVPAGAPAISAGYLTALKAQLSQYWLDVSGGQIQVTWAPDRFPLVLKQTLAQWSKMGVKAKIDAVRDQAKVPGGVYVVLIANDATTPSGSTPHDSSPYLHASLLAPAGVAHEMGHFFEWAGTQRTGHADVARTFFRDEYGDPTCLMGGENNKLWFRDPLVPALPLLPNSTRSGPVMNPALIDQCGWLDTGSPLVAILDRTALGSVTLQPWTGAPPAGGAGAPRVAVVDGVGPDGGRLYVCVRQASGWDRGFAKGSLAAPLLAPRHPGSNDRWVCAYLSSTAYPDSLLLALHGAVKGDSIWLELLPIRISIAWTTKEEVGLELFRDRWRGSSRIEGVECDPNAQVAVAAWGRTADMYVIDRAGSVRYNHFNGDAWEHLPWPAIDGVRCDPLGGIAAVARREGLVDVFVTDTSGTVHRRQRHHRIWSPAWDPIAGGGLDAKSSLAASRLDEQTIMLCGVRPTDRQVSRTVIDQDGQVVGNWRSAPPSAPMRRVAATPAEPVGGRIYATAINNPDRTIWDTPDIDKPDPDVWASVGSLMEKDARPITAGRMVGADDFVVVGTTPLTGLFWTGANWDSEELHPLDREPEGGLACFSMEKECFHVAWIDTAGGVNVGEWSLRDDCHSARNQYQAESTVTLQAATRHFVQAKNGGGDGMSADSNNPGDWERLRMLEQGTYVINAGGTRRVVVFQTHDGHYVGAVGGGGSHLFATASQVGPWERFYLHELGGGKVTLGCIDEWSFWTANGGGGGALGAAGHAEKGWETFQLAVVAP
jgi:hypothetical protein